MGAFVCSDSAQRAVDDHRSPLASLPPLPASPSRAFHAETLIDTRTHPPSFQTLHYRIALVCPLAGMLFDFFDGKVARWRNESSMLGQELDSLADSVSAKSQRSPAGGLVGTAWLPLLTGQV